MGRLRSFRFLLAGVILATTVFLSTGAHAGVMNGKFEAATNGMFDDWDTFVDFEKPMVGSDSNQFALFSEGSSFLGAVQLEQLVVIPANASKLSFDFNFVVEGGPSINSTVPDSFQASLLDPNNFFEGVLPADPLFGSAFFVVDDRGDTLANGAVAPPSMTGPDLRSGWTRISLDIRSLAGRELLLEFQLLYFFEPPGASSVSLDNVTIVPRDTNVVPEPTSFAIIGMLFLLIAASKYSHRFQLFAAPAI